MSSPNLNLSTVELTSTLLTAPLNGAPSSTDYNSSQRSNLVDLSTIVSFINNQILPLINALPATALLPVTAPLGIQGDTIWTNPNDQSQLFFDILSNAPLTIYDSFNVLNGIISTNSQQLIDLGVEVAALQSLLASTNQNDISLALQNLTGAVNQLTINLNLADAAISLLQTEIGTLQAGSGLIDVLTTAGDMIYSATGNTPARLGIGNSGYLLTVQSGLPAWIAPTLAADTDVSISGPTTGQVLTWNGTNWTNEAPTGGGGGGGSNIYTVSSFEGDPTLTQPAANQILLVSVLPGSSVLTSVTLPVGLTGSSGGCLVAPTGNISVTIKHNGTSVGSLNIATGQTTATFTFASQVVLSPLDIVSFVFQGTIDATVAGLYWTVVGTRAGGGAGSTTLAGDTDVNISNPTNNQVLTYNSTLGKWVNATGVSGGSTTLAGDADVSITAPTTGQLLTYNGTVWVNQTPVKTLASDTDVSISAPSAGQVLIYNGSHWVNQPSNVLIPINNQTANYTLQLSDKESMIRMNVISGNTVTVPPNSSVSFSVGDSILVRQTGVGSTTIVAGSGVTITTPSSLILAGQYSTIQLIKVAINTWDLIGNTQ